MNSLKEGEQLLGASGSEDESSGLVVVFRALFPGRQTGKDNGTAFKAFGAVDEVIFKE
jgi:hypothetical protein